MSIFNPINTFSKFTSSISSKFTYDILFSSQFQSSKDFLGYFCYLMDRKFNESEKLVVVQTIATKAKLRQHYISR